MTTPTPAVVAGPADPDDGLLLTGEAARIAGVSPVTIRKWKGDGKLQPARHDPDAPAGEPRSFYRREDVLAAAAAHAETRRGGKREGSGRPRKPPPPPDPGLAAAVDAGEARNAMAARAEAGLAPPDDALRADRLLNCTETELRALAHLDPGITGLHKAALDRLRAIQDLRKATRLNDLEDGRLYRKDDADAAFAAGVSAVRRELDALPDRAAARVAGLAWLSPDAADAVVRLVRDAGGGDDLVAEARRMLAPPAGLEGLVREALADETDRAAANLRDAAGAAGKGVGGRGAGS